MAFGNRFDDALAYCETLNVPLAAENFSATPREIFGTLPFRTLTRARALKAP